MVANWAMKEEFTVGWGFHPNKNIPASYVAETLVLSDSQGEGDSS